MEYRCSQGAYSFQCHLPNPGLFVHRLSKSPKKVYQNHKTYGNIVSDISSKILHQSTLKFIFTVCFVVLQKIFCCERRLVSQSKNFININRILSKFLTVRIKRLLQFTYPDRGPVCMECFEHPKPLLDLF